MIDDGTLELGDYCVVLNDCDGLGDWQPARLQRSQINGERYWLSVGPDHVVEWNEIKTIGPRLIPPSKETHSCT